jgi:hypothetical protein
MGELICGIVALYNMKGRRHRNFLRQNQVGKYKGSRFIIMQSVRMTPWLQLLVLEASHNNVPFHPFIAINMGTFINKR